MSFLNIIFLSLQGMAILDFIGEESKKAVEAAAYADAVSELIGEISPDEELLTRPTVFGHNQAAYFVFSY